MSITLEQYMEQLNNIIEKYPEALKFKVIYSHNDEGNEYQEVMNLPDLCYVKPQKGYRFLECNLERNKDFNAILIN